MIVFMSDVNENQLSTAENNQNLIFEVIFHFDFKIDNQYTDVLLTIQYIGKFSEVLTT